MILPILYEQIKKFYEAKDYVNINEIESNIKNGRKWSKLKDRKYEVNIGFSLSPQYVIRGMMTLAGLLDSQKPETKIRLHIAVVNNFPIKSMMKIYELRERIREDVEFNFYNAKRVETDLKNIHPKGNGAMAKMLLPEILPEDIEKYFLLDGGDVIVVRDLHVVYNWNMGGYLIAGTPDPDIKIFGKISNKKLNTYVNGGHYLTNVKKNKEMKIYDKIVENRMVYKGSIVTHQSFLNDVLYGKIGVMPYKYGILAAYGIDERYDDNPHNNRYVFIDHIKKEDRPPTYPKSKKELIKQALNPFVVHQWNGKWFKGKGMSIYRRLAQYDLKLAGIWKEACDKYPGYCSRL